MSRTRIIIACMATLLCIASVTSSYWAQTFSLNQKYMLVGIGILEAVLFIWIVTQCRRWLA